MPGDFLDSSGGDAGAGHVGEACVPHRMSCGSVQVEALEGVCKDVVGSCPAQVSGGRVFRREEPYAVRHFLLVFKEAFAKFRMNRNIAEDFFLFLETWNTQCIFDATISGEDIFLFDGDDFADSQSGV